MSILSVYCHLREPVQKCIDCGYLEAVFGNIGTDREHREELDSGKCWNLLSQDINEGVEMKAIRACDSGKPEQTVIHYIIGPIQTTFRSRAL